MNAASPQSSDSPGEGVRLTVLLLIVLFSLIGYGGVAPLLPFYGVVFDAPAWQVTLLFAIYSVGQFVGELVWGRLSDRIGRRPVLLATMLCGAAAFAVFAFAPTIWLAILARGVSGFFTGNMSTVQGYVADITPRHRLTQRMGLVSAVFSIGFVLGPVLGGALARPELGAVGIRLPVLMAAGLYLLAGLGVLVFLRESLVRRVEASGAVSQLMALRGAFANPVVRRLLLMTFLSYTAFSAIIPTLGLWSQAQLDWSPREVGLLLGLATGAGAAAQLLLSRFAVRKFGELATIGAALIFSAVGMFAASFIDSSLTAAICLTAAIAGHMAAQPAVASLVSSSAAADSQGSVLGAYTASASAARVTGPMLAGVCISMIGPSSPFMMSSMLLLPAIWLAAGAHRARRRY